MSRNNFPPFFKWWAYHPDDDLPENSRQMAKQIFWLFCLTPLAYLFNVIGALGCLSGSAAEVTTSPATKIILSLIFFVVLCPLSFEVSYFVFYNALMKGKALRYFCFLVTYAIWIAVLILSVIGLDQFGSVGFIQMISLFGTSAKFTAVIALIFCILGAAIGVCMVLSYIRLIHYWKKNGIKRKAFQEASVLAAEKAYENKDTIAEVAKDNPELVASAAKTAASYN